MIDAFSTEPLEVPAGADNRVSCSPYAFRQKAENAWPAPIDFYFDFISPYGYLASTRIEHIAARHGRAVAWRPFLQGVTVLQVMGLKPLLETPLKSTT